MARETRLATAAVLALSLLAACFLVWQRAGRAASDVTHATRIVTLRLPTRAAFALSAIRFTPNSQVRSVRLDALGNLILQTGVATLTVEVPELCALRVDAGTRDVVLTPRALFDVGPDLAQVGYDAAVAIHVTPGCAEAARGEIGWRQLEGPPLEDLSSEARGFRLQARTQSLRTFFPEGLPPGLVPVSPRTQGRYVLEATARAVGRPPLTRTITLTSIARATGLSSLAVSQRVMLGGTGWRVQRAPRGSHAQVELSAGIATFAPDAPGRFALRASDGTQLELQALTHDRTPMDCGRAECHASIASAALSSPMTHALTLPLSEAPRALAASGCMLDCHAVGERGLDDGGFLAVAATLGVQPTHAESWSDLPHALQRLGGVRCTSCHGPGALPPPEGRARILRADVCATCHDAPPRYGHVEAWRRSRMAEADATPSTRAAGCASCHTTAGFLSAVGVRPRSDASPQPDDERVGIACAACHAPHGDHLVGGLIRAIPAPAAIGTDPRVTGTSSSVCLPCHAPEPSTPAPSASAAGLWLGRVRLPAALGGDELRGEAPHADVRNGCVGCHGGRRAGAPRGTDHTFAVTTSTCLDCHQQTPQARHEPNLTVRAQALVDALRRSCGVSDDDDAAYQTPQHARASVAPCGRSGRRARALYLAQLVAEDGAAEIHNAPFARLLLAEAEALTNGSPVAAVPRSPTGSQADRHSAR